MGWIPDQTKSKIGNTLDTPGKEPSPAPACVYWPQSVGRTSDRALFVLSSNSELIKAFRFYTFIKNPWFPYNYRHENSCERPGERKEHRQTDRQAWISVVWLPCVNLGDRPPHRPPTFSSCIAEVVIWGLWSFLAKSTAPCTLICQVHPTPFTSQESVPLCVFNTLFTLPVTICPIMTDHFSASPVFLNPLITLAFTSFAFLFYV